MFSVSSVCPVQDYQCVRYIEAILQQEFDTAERKQRGPVAAVQRQVQKQAAEKAMCLPDSHCESTGLCSASKTLLRSTVKETKLTCTEQVLQSVVDGVTATIVNR